MKILKADINEKKEAYDTLQRIFPTWTQYLSQDVYRHSERVGVIAVEMARAFEMNLFERVQIMIGCLLHDIGKCDVNQSILNQKEAFSVDDRIIAQRHAMQGFFMIKTFPFDKIVFDIVKYHHEKLDGSGYPDELPARKISPYVQIVTVADIFEAITANRVYADAESYSTAIEILRGENENKVNQTAVNVLEMLATQGLIPQAKTDKQMRLVV